MTAINANKVESSLKRKGFIQEPGDHRYFYFYYNGELTDIRTKTSNCKQDINDYLISQMSKQVHLSKKDFVKLVTCTLSKEEYEKKLIEKNLL